MLDEWNRLFLLLTFHPNDLDDYLSDTDTIVSNSY